MLLQIVSPVRRSLAATFVGLTLVAGSTPASPLELKLEDVRVAGGGFSFEVKDPELLGTLPVRPRDKDIHLGLTPSYRVYLDLNSIEYASRGGYFRYTFYAEPKAGNPGKPTSFAVIGQPAGAFLAQMVNVDFEIPGKVPEYGEISVPIFSIEAPSYLVYPAWEKPEEIELPGAKEISLRFTNQLATIPLSIKGIRQPSLQDVLEESRLGLRDSKEFRELDINPATVLDGVLVLNVVPSSRAFMKVLFSRPGESEHASIKAYLDYTAPWGPPQSLEVLVPVRFMPSPYLLFLAVALGAALGSSIPVLAGRRKSSRWLKAFLASVLIGFIVELIAMALVGKLDSQFRLLGFELDPFDLRSATLIGVATGLLGFRGHELLKGFFPGLGSRSRAAENP